MGFNITFRIFTSFLFFALFLNFNICVGVAQTATQYENEKELFLVAQKAFEDGFYDVAARYIQQFLEQYPESQRQAEINILLGQCYFFKNQYLKAYDVFQSTLQYSKLKDATFFWLGETYLKGLDYTQAQKQYQKLIDQYPESRYVPQAAYSLGWVYFEQGLFTKSVQAFGDFIIKFPKHQLAQDAAFKLGESEYYLHNYKNTIQQFKNYVMKYPQSKRHAQSYFYVGESYYYLNNYEMATTYYVKSIEIAKNSKLILMDTVSLGWSYLKLKQFDRAKEYFDQSYKFAKEKSILSDEVFLGQASLYVEMKDYAKALKTYSQLIELFPNSKRILDARLGMANAYYAINDYASAIAMYTKLIEKLSIEGEGYSKHWEVFEKAYFGLAWSYLKIGNIDASIKSFRVVEDKADNKIVKISALTQIGDAYQEVGQLNKALAIYDQILKKYADSPYTDYVQYRQGVSLLKMEKVEAATLSFQTLQVNFPQSKYLSDVKYYLAVAHFKKGKWRFAQEQSEAFIADLTSDNEFLAEAQYILALSFFNLEEYSQALRVFQKIVKEYPQQKDMFRNAQISIAKCYYKTKAIKDGIKKFKFLLEKYPKSKIAQESLMWLGDHYLTISEFDQAISYYKQIVQDFPGSEQLNRVYYQLGQAYQVKEEFEMAINFFKRVEDSDGELYAQAKLAIAEIFAKRFDPTLAIEIYENIALTSLDFSRDAYVKIAMVHNSTESYKKSIDAYRHALKSSKGRSLVENAEIQFYIGDTYELLHQSDKAVESYLKIAYLYPDEIVWIIKSYLRVARIFEDNEKWQEAKTIYRKVMTLKTDELKFAQERIEWIEYNIK